MVRERSSVIALVLLVLSGCGGSSSGAGSTTFAAEPYLSVASDTGRLTVEVHTAPDQPPARGAQSLELVIADESTKAPAAGLTLEVVPWMPAMGHGTSVTPSVTESAPGTYVVADVDFFMAGTWELRTTISGPVADHVQPSFQIQ